MPWSIFTFMRAVRRSSGILRGSAILPGGREMEIEQRPHERWRGRLKNGNWPGDRVQSRNAAQRHGAAALAAVLQCETGDADYMEA